MREEKNYEVWYKVDGKSGYVIIVKATNAMMARRIAKGEISGKAGFAGKNISIGSAYEIR